MAGWLWLWRTICGGCGAGQRDDARGLMLVPPLGRCVAHIGGVRQVMPPWFGSWFVPMPAPWCAYWCGAGCGHDVFDVGAVNIVIRWAAELWRMAVSWPWLRRHGSCRSRTGFACDFAIHWAAVQFVLRVRRPWVWLKCRVATAGCNSCFIKKRIPLHQL